MPPNLYDSELPRRFYSLDVLRGLGALAVVIDHWGMFSYYDPSVLKPSDSPFFNLLRPAYLEGWRAVDMFFSLSGFIFFWLYANSIKSHAFAAKDFFILRFSRLYPLHFATLLVVALGQFLLSFSHRPQFQYGNNDALHFVEQLLFFAGTDSNYSFNGPAWSITVEIGMYILFFSFCWLGRVSWGYLLLYICLGEALVVHHGEYLGFARGILSFFLGALSFQIFFFLHRRHLFPGGYLIFAGTTAIFWIAIPLIVDRPAGIEMHDTAAHLSILAHFDKEIHRFSGQLYELVLFPLTLITLALWETRRGTLGRRFAILGDISYSTYLIHFPLLLFFLISALAFGFSVSIFRSPYLMGLFFAMLLLLSWSSYHFFERPTQNWLRVKLIFDAKKRAAPSLGNGQTSSKCSRYW